MYSYYYHNEPSFIEYECQRNPFLIESNTYIPNSKASEKRQPQAKIEVVQTESFYFVGSVKL